MLRYYYPFLVVGLGIEGYALMLWCYSIISLFLVPDGVQKSVPKVWKIVFSNISVQNGVIHSNVCVYVLLDSESESSGNKYFCILSVYLSKQIFSVF